MSFRSLGVVVPTRNSLRYLPQHVEAMNHWTDLASEVVVVDSESTDESVSFLRSNIKHANVRVFNHPPGLYASWNFGIGQLRSEYCLISTTGDTISRVGVLSMLEQAAKTDCDILLSKPSFTDTDGHTHHKRWPIDEVIDYYSINGFHELSGLEAAIFAASHPESALLGSSASNLYKTSTLQNLPFPTDCGVGGDGLWGWKHAGEVRWCVSSSCYSTFLLHEPQSARKDLEQRPDSNPADILRKAADLWDKSGKIASGKLTAAEWDKLMLRLSLYLDAKAIFDQARKRKPWVVRPSAWRARLMRGRRRRELINQRNISLSKLAQNR